MKKGLSAEAYLEPLFQKSQKNLEHLKSLKHNSHPCQISEQTLIFSGYG